MNIQIHSLNDIVVDGETFNSPADACEKGTEEVSNAILTYEGELLQRVVVAEQILKDKEQELKSAKLTAEQNEIANQESRKSLDELREATKVEKRALETDLRAAIGEQQKLFKEAETLKEENKTVHLTLNQIRHVTEDPETETEPAVLALVGEAQKPARAREIDKLRAQQAALETQIAALQS